MLRTSAPRKAVDALVVVSDHGQVAVTTGKLDEHLVLGAVGVLVLVDQDLVEAPPPVVPHGLVLLQEVDQVEDEVVEVHPVRLPAQGLVALVDKLQDPVLRRFAGDVGRPENLRLRLRDRLRQRREGVPAGIQVEVGERPLEDRSRVVLVEDREARAVPDQLDVGPQHPGRDGMEGADPHRRLGRAELLRQPGPHLPGRLVGEGQGEDPLRLGDARPDEIGDPHREHAGLAAAGAGEDQQRALLVDHRLALGRVEGEDVHAPAGNHSQPRASSEP